MDGAPTVRHLEPPGLTSPAHTGDTPDPARPGGLVGPTRLPTSGMPAKDDLDYLKTLIELGLLLLAVPWLLTRLARDPKATSRRVASKQLGGS